MLNLDLNAFFSSMFSSPMNAFFIRRHLTDASRSLTGAAVINNLRSVFYNTSPNTMKQGFQIVAKTAKKDQDEPFPIGPIIPPHIVTPPFGGNDLKASVQKGQDIPIIPPHFLDPYDGNRPMLRRARRSLHMQPPPPPPNNLNPKPLPPQRFPGDTGGLPPPPIDGPKGNKPPPPPPGDHHFNWDGPDGHHDHDHKDHQPDGKKGHHHGFFGGAWDSDSDSDGDSDSEDAQKEKKTGGRPRRGPPVPEDRLFSGALGFGAEGDMCLYQNLDQLSDPCVSAVSDLYALRANYWAEDQVMHNKSLFVVLRDS